MPSFQARTGVAKVRGLFPRFVFAYELEGFVAKRKASTYQPGVRSSEWRMIKRKGAVEPQRFARARESL